MNRNIKLIQTDSTLTFTWFISDDPRGIYLSRGKAVKHNGKFLSISIPIEGLDISDFFLAEGFQKSKNSIRRLILQKGLRINDYQIQDEHAWLMRDINGYLCLLEFGTEDGKVYSTSD